jgi:hypothetical protein
MVVQAAPDFITPLVGDPATAYDDSTVTGRKLASLWLTVGAACVVVGLIVVVAVVAMRTTGRHDDHSAPVRPAAGTTQQRLWDLAARLARQDDTTLVSAQAVQTTERVAMRAYANASSSRDTDKPVWVVQAIAQDDFNCNCGRAISAKYLVLIVDPATFESYGGGIDPKPFDLSALGTVVDLGG